MPSRVEGQGVGRARSQGELLVHTFQLQRGELTHHLQVSGSSAIQCYCPANGRLLGLVNPATPDGIDRAVAKAKEAQSQWARTTFAQRRKVLRTMLQCVTPLATVIFLVLFTSIPTQVHPRQSGSYSHCCMPRLRQDKNRCIPRGNFGDSRETEMDHSTWRESTEAREEADKLSDDVQVERSQMGADGGHWRLCELEVYLHFSQLAIWTFQLADPLQLSRTFGFLPAFSIVS